MNFLSLFKTTQDEGPRAEPPHLVAKRISAQVHRLKAKIKIYAESTGPSPLFHHMFDLLEADHARKIANLRNRHSHNVAESNKGYHQEFAVLQGKYASELSGFLDLMTNNTTDKQVKRVFAANLRTKSSKLSISLECSASSNSQFSSSSALSIDDDAPGWILDPISFAIMKDPVVTPSGITYEKAPLIDYLQHHGHKDPITRKPLHRENLVPNLAIKNVVTEFLREREIV